MRKTARPAMKLTNLKIERDALNEKVKLLKAQRDAVRINVVPIMDEVTLLTKKSRRSRKTCPELANANYKRN